MVSEAINEDIDAVRMLDAKVPAGLANVIGAHPVEVHESARLYPNAVLDAERGPVVVHERAVIRPGAVICGPCSIGPESVVVDHALIKPNTVIGPVCRIGGEAGWFHSNTLWAIRGTLDRILMGVGTSRGRKAFISMTVSATSK